MTIQKQEKKSGKTAVYELELYTEYLGEAI
jgi:hypothetical protein